MLEAGLFPLVSLPGLPTPLGHIVTPPPPSLGIGGGGGGEMGRRKEGTKEYILFGGNPENLKFSVHTFSLLFFSRGGRDTDSPTFFPERIVKMAKCILADRRKNLRKHHAF